MLIGIYYIGRFVLCLLLGSWADTAGDPVRLFALAAGGLASGLMLGVIAYLCTWPWCQVDAVTAFVGIPAGTLIFTFVIEKIHNKTHPNHPDGVA